MYFLHFSSYLYTTLYWRCSHEVIEWFLFPYAVLHIGRSQVRSQLVSLKFFIDIKSFRSHYGPGVNSASNRNEYQEHFLGDKDGQCVRLTTLPPSFAVVMKSGHLNFLEPSGTLQACNGTDFYFRKNASRGRPCFTYWHIP